MEVKNLKKSFGTLKAIDGISFKVEAGVVFGMLGPNGAGKSTTIEILTGLQNKDHGEVDILGLDMASNRGLLKEKLGVQLQSPALYEKLTVKEMAELFASFYNEPLSVTEVIGMVGLEDKLNERTENLSGGQRHRLAVALAIIGDGEIIFLDEPTTGLDPQSRRKLWDAIKSLKERGKTIFLTTHYMDEAEKLCDQLLIIDKGRVIAEGSPGSLLEDYLVNNTEDLFLKLTGREIR
jgi:ABC-2 type transport system ATP-binding protein